MSGAAMLLLLVIAAGADGITQQFGFIGFYVSICVCGLMVFAGEVKHR